MVVQHSRIPPFVVVPTVLVILMTADAAPWPRDAASTVMIIACPTKFHVADTPDIKNLHKCLAEHNKDSGTDSVVVKIDDQFSELKLYLPHEAKGETILINCRPDGMYPATSHDDDGDILKLDCSPYAKIIVKGLVKSPETAIIEERLTKECSKRSNKVCSSERQEDWVNCPYTETELRPPDVDFETLGKKCLMIGDATGRWMYDACGKLDCLWCGPFTNYDSETLTCKPCTAGGSSYPSPPHGHSCQAGFFNSTGTNFAPTSATQSSTTATIVTQTISTAVVMEDLSTPEMHSVPHTPGKPENSAGAIDATTTNSLNHSPEETTISLAIIGILILIGGAAFLYHRFCGKDKNSAYKPGVRTEDDYSSASTCPSTDQSTFFDENVNTTPQVSTKRLYS